MHQELSQLRNQIAQLTREADEAEREKEELRNGLLAEQDCTKAMRSMLMQHRGQMQQKRSKAVEAHEALTLMLAEEGRMLDDEVELCQSSSAIHAMSASEGHGQQVGRPPRDGAATVAAASASKYHPSDSAATRAPPNSTRKTRNTSKVVAWADSDTLAAASRSFTVDTRSSSSSTSSEHKKPARSLNRNGTWDPRTRMNQRRRGVAITPSAEGHAPSLSRTPTEFVELFTGKNKWDDTSDYMSSKRLAWFRRVAWHKANPSGVVLDDHVSEARRRRISSGSNTRAFFVQLLSVFCLAIAMVLTVAFSSLNRANPNPWSGPLRLFTGMAIWLSFLMMQVLGYLDILFNLVVSRKKAHKQVYALRHGLCLYGKPGCVWRFILRECRGRGAWVPMCAAEIIERLMWGFPAGSIMISYRWGPVGDSDLPRRAAKMLNGTRLNRVAWLDIEELIPGFPCLESEQEAVRAATFRLVFLSAQYLKSPNCNAELEMLKDEPGKTLFLVYTSQRSEKKEPLKPPKEIILGLKKGGHLVHPIDPYHRFSEGVLLRSLIESNAIQKLLAERSPKINDQWGATACALCERPRLCDRLASAFVRFGYILLIPIVANVGVVCFIDYYLHSTLTLDLLQIHQSLR